MGVICAAVEPNGTFAMASDSLNLTGKIRASRTPKIKEVRNSKGDLYYVGCVGASVTSGQKMLQAFIFTMNQDGGCVELILQTIFRHVSIYNTNSSTGVDMLVVSKEGIWQMDAEGGIYFTNAGVCTIYAAIGSGTECALGSMYGYCTQIGAPKAIAIVQKGVSGACLFIADCELPMQCLPQQV
jgi:ATP-dependent protease HslVU (ClpYQ) peptidase subunit